MMPEQLVFPFFIGEPEPVLPRPSRYRRRLAGVATIALSTALTFMPRHGRRGIDVERAYRFLSRPTRERSNHQ